ncbi:hypothetical protein [Thalassospira xiamenensis]|uniref:Intracellular multiplication protein IcmE n=1 Tax=Thalassospira xiamenensis TaxID=220697 RepID=A0A285TTP9_9PROT|nr:hypothetical protein [Thalassospira xiamenensis]SOC27156.1 intracellular multiplication protein IcmE [Thalassospira xiamenensis]
MSDQGNTAERRENGYKRIFKDKGSRVMIITVGLVILGAAAYAFLSKPNVEADVSSIRRPPMVSGNTQGGEAVSLEYKRNLEIADDQRAKQAEKVGGSAMPTLVASPVGSDVPISFDLTPEPQPKPDVVVPQRPAAESPKPVANAVKSTATTVSPKEKVVLDEEQQKAVLNMAKYLTEMTKGYGTSTPSETTIYYNPSKKKEVATDDIAGGWSGGVQTAGYSAPQGGYSATQEFVPTFTPPVAGSILYARTIGMVSSDVPGPVIAEILQGPYTNARLIGSFTANDFGMVITFSTMTVSYTENGKKKSVVVPIEAVAVDTTHLGTSVASDVDRHLFQKIALGFASSFVEGLGSAVGKAGSTTVNSANGSSTTTNPLLSTDDKLLVAAGEAAKRTGSILDREFINRKTTVTVDAEMPFGLLFLGS